MILFYKTPDVETDGQNLRQLIVVLIPSYLEAQSEEASREIAPPRHNVHKDTQATFSPLPGVIVRLDPP